MKKIAWLTDPHFNFAGIQKAEALMREVASWGADALLVSGDIGEAPDLEGWLELMAARAGAPVYFVLGNHDFYHASIAEVRAVAGALAAQRGDALHYLLDCDVVSLTDDTALIGHDGWGDGRCGDVLNSRVRLSDFLYIQDLRVGSQEALAAHLNMRGDEAAAHIRPRLERALADHEHVLLLTHVPPFREAAWHEGNISDDHWAPFFVCQAMGEALVEVMRAHPSRRLTVLCGHTHSHGEAYVLPNLHVRTGGAVYRRPALQAPLLIT